MVAVHQNMPPPPPPAPFAGPPHQMHPGDIPRVVHTPGSINTANLVDDMARLDVNTGRQMPRVNRAGREPITIKEVSDPRAVYYYEGWRFFKSEPLPGQKSSWNKVEKTPINLSQSDLFKLVQKRAKKDSSIDQYQRLTKMKRTVVDEFIDELRHKDPRYEWTCVYVKEEDRPFKGKNARRGDYETVSMDVVLMRKPVDSGYSKEPQPVHVGFDEIPSPRGRDSFHAQFDPVISQDMPRQMNKHFDHDAQWVGMDHGQVPQMQNHVPQQGHPQFHPQAGPAGQHPMGGRPHVNQVNQEQWSSMPTNVRQHHQQQQQHQHRQNVQQQQHPVMSGARGPGPANAPPPFEVLNGANAMGHEARHEAPHPGQGQNFQHGQQFFPQPGKEKFGFPPNMPHGAQQPRAPHAPAPPLEDHDYFDTSSADDDSVLFDQEDFSSITDSSDDDRAHQFRGSLYRKHSSKTRKPEAGYRTHYRKQPTATVHDPRYIRSNNSRYPDGHVEVVPAQSKNTPRRAPKGYTREVARLSRDRPKVIQEQPVVLPDEMAVVGGFEDKYSKLRARNDIRTQILDEREARVERREQLVDHRARMLEEKSMLEEMGRWRTMPYYRHY